MSTVRRKRAGPHPMGGTFMRETVYGKKSRVHKKRAGPHAMGGMFEHEVKYNPHKSGAFGWKLSTFKGHKSKSRKRKR